MKNWPSINKLFLLSCALGFWINPVSSVAEGLSTDDVKEEEVPYSTSTSRRKDEERIKDCRDLPSAHTRARCRQKLRRGDDNYIPEHLKHHLPQNVRERYEQELESSTPENDSKL